MCVYKVARRLHVGTDVIVPWTTLQRWMDRPGITAGLGAVAAHSNEARDEAVRELLSNHTGVLRDIGNPSSTSNIENTPLTQLALRHIHPRELAAEAGAQVEEAVQGKALAAFGAKSEAEKAEDKQIDSKYNDAAAAAKQTAAFANAAVADAENDVGVAEVELAEAEKKAEAAEADDVMSADAKAEAAEALRAAKETLKVKKGALNAAREAARQQKQGANDRMEAEMPFWIVSR